VVRDGRGYDLRFYPEGGVPRFPNSVSDVGHQLQSVAGKGKGSQYPLDKGMGGPQIWSEHRSEETNLVPAQNTNADV
jgi:hypothetical protein